MILTNPTEFEHAIQQNWKPLDDIRGARNTGNALVLYDDAKGRRLWNKLK